MYSYKMVINVAREAFLPEGSTGRQVDTASLHRHAGPSHRSLISDQTSILAKSQRHSRWARQS